MRVLTQALRNGYRHSGCRYLLTEALPHGQRMDAIQTVNPFLLSPEDLLAAAP